MTSSTARGPRRAPGVVTALCLIGGLIIGLALAAVVAAGQKSTYSATSNYAVLPGLKATTENLGQVGFLTPVFAAIANDPTTATQVEKQLGRKPATATVQTYPDSELLFTVTTTGDSSELVYKTAQAYEQVLLGRANSGDPVSPDQVRLSVAAHADIPADPDSLDPKVIYLAGALGGALLGLALALGLARRRTADSYSSGRGA